MAIDTMFQPAAPMPHGRAGVAEKSVAFAMNSTTLQHDVAD